MSIEMKPRGKLSQHRETASTVNPIQCSGGVGVNRFELEQLLAELRQRRSEFEDVEAKAARGGTPQGIHETLSAFANRSGGGTILFGVDDRTLTPVGVGNPDQLQKDLASKASEMEPPLRLKMYPHEIDGKLVLAVQVPEVDPELKPCYYKPSGLPGGAYVRVGDGDRRMTDYEVYMLRTAHKTVNDDRAPVEGATLDDLDSYLIDKYLEKLRQGKPHARYLQEPKEKVLRTLGVLTVVDGRNVPTLAGLLTFGRYPQQFYPNLVITVMVLPADSTIGRERFLDNVRIEGNLMEGLDEAMQVIQRNLRKRTLITGLIHQDLPEYPLEALREALVNAVVHRDYSKFAVGTQVQVRIHPDRIEIQNPGGLHGPVTIDRLGEPGVQSARNALLARMLEELGPMENRGSGIQTMLKAMRQAHLAPPRFEDRGTLFKVTFLNHTLLSDEVLAWLQQYASDPGLNDRQRYALAYLKVEGNRLVSRDYQMLNNVDPIVASRELRGLVEAGLLEPFGSRGGTYYQLASSIRSATIRQQVQVQATALPSMPDNYRLVYELICSKGPIRTVEVAEQLGIKRSSAAYVIRQLVNMGLVRPTQKTHAKNQAYVAANQA